MIVYGDAGNIIESPFGDSDGLVAAKLRRFIETCTPEQKKYLRQTAAVDVFRRNQTTEAFMEAVWKDERGDLITLDGIHRRWHEFIREQLAKGFTRIGIIAPFKHGKTPNLLAWVTYKITTNRNLRVKIICNDDENAKKRTATIKQYIDGDKTFQSLFGQYIRPNKKERWTNNSIRIHRDSLSTDNTVESKSVLATGIGGTYDLLLFDDPCDFNNSVISPAKRETVKDAIDNVWLSRLDRGGIALYIGTPWHEADATHTLLDRKGWAWLIHAVNRDITGIREGVKIN